MEKLILQAFFCFIASTFFSILNNIEKKYCLLCGTLGMTTWLTYTILPSILTIDLPTSALIASAILSFITNLIAKYIIIPESILNISGIITIVPGGFFYKCINFLAEKNFNGAFNSGSKALLIGLSISIGIMINGILHLIFKDSFFNPNH
ncbi:threonine/serine exporter family protein [Enterococcus rivorum]|uniref:Threonine/Serine exporter ThrE domain-containing protein n=1 Tax=Enterococcus rivorum TaxID=762845 RepID=A0A1E5KS73_9ENTE|nr:threonine/serine exporter family protein [Enterococcus rivorum]MBP2097369.1 uncharacterized membrane protein YjjB (DUF3815 family) [Enterococcus rivorum]OEH80720.1 hypothetical protein BCR26_06865 [Enterococcus rivorum]